MAQTQLQSGKADPNVAEVAAAWTEGFKGFLNSQGELVERLKQSSDWWIARWQSEAGLVSKLAANIGASRSFPETVMAWQQWTARCLETIAEDCQHMRDDYQSFVEMSARAVSNSWSSAQKNSA